MEWKFGEADVVGAGGRKQVNSGTIVRALAFPLREMGVNRSFCG